MERLRPKKMFGQHFLTDRNVLVRIVEAAGISAGDRVLEVGPGRGSLTRALADKGAHVLAVEVDRELAPLLENEFAACSNVEIVRGDVLQVDLRQLLVSRWDGQWKVVANLPYNISSQVLLRFLDDWQLFSRLMLMLQKEVGERLVAPPACKEYGILSVFCRLHFDIYREFIVRPGSFYPPPAVDSLVLRFEPLPRPRADVGDEAFFRRIVKGAFGQRRKTLLNALKPVSLTEDVDNLVQALSRCGIDGKRRGETLSLEEFAVLSRALSQTGPD
ncbi:MAG TPA: 16S rRNA (adenine(1518)-N(6)/adenine(1519)-N(6))-dimethyltransferase RsmA [Geobacteraceae bacterium]|nr:16S rRNA (adenine(1518)-N(6)/adenine(1519)-N(6))-dimethyltransferase RsmA [Geobacteraceae bacterium]